MTDLSSADPSSPGARVPRLFVLFSTLAAAEKARVAEALRALLVAGGDPQARVHHYVNGVTVVASEVTPALEAALRARFVEIRTVEPNPRVTLDTLGAPLTPSALAAPDPSAAAVLGGRERVRRLLDAHHPADEAEARALAEIRAAIDGLPAPFARTQWPAHLTASAILVHPEGHAVCLLHHRALGRLLQPGGHFEAGDGGDPVVAARRETVEEVGAAADAPAGAALLDVDVHPIPARAGGGARPPEPAHRHLDLRILLRARHPALAADARETCGAAWWAWADALHQPLDAALLRALRKAQARIALLAGTGVDDDIVRDANADS